MRPSSIIESKEREYDEETMSLSWEFILEEHDAIHRLAKHMCRGDLVLLDDMMSDIVPVYVPALFSTWDPVKGATLRGHVMRGLRLYFWKLSNYRHSPGDSTLPDDGSTHCPKRVLRCPNEDIKDEVRYILERLPPYERSLLTMYHVAGLTHEEVAGVLEVSKGTACSYYKKALELARELFKGRGDELSW